MGRRASSAFTSNLIFVSFLLVTIFLTSRSVSLGQTGHKSLSNPDAQNSGDRAQAAPAGAVRCKFCHPTEVEGYSRSAMANSLHRAQKEPDGVVTAGGSTITMHSSTDGFWQRWENNGDMNEYRVDFVVGSGNHASGYLIDISGHLFQSPVAFYKGRHAYGLAPGYENLPDPDFTRPISEECVICHSGTALHVPGTLNQYRTPVFSAEGITCERCHGPSEKHLADPRAGTIVNPAKLESGARDSVCEQCHLFGAARVPNPGKHLSDFVPGQRLEETYTVYHTASSPNAPSGDFKVISHVEQLALSTCSRKSEGKLWCGTCHNPHDIPSSTNTVSYYRQKCLSCHTTNFPTAHPAKDSNCLECHMPKRDAQDGGHAAFTDHRIQRHSVAQHDGQANTDIAAWRQPSPNFQKRNLGIAYIGVGMERHSAPFVIQGYRTLTEVQQEFRDDADFFKWIGAALLVGKQTQDAKTAFQRALQLDSDSTLTQASAASPYIQEGDSAGAIPYLERSIALDPLNLPVASTLIGLYQKEGESSKAAALADKMKSAIGHGAGIDATISENSAAPASKRTEEIFKNIQILKGIPSEQLIPAMQFMASSLGVECSYCHVEGHFEKDDKKQKQTARKMMQMMFALNKANFDDQREITCYTCHRGTHLPSDTPALGDEFRGDTNPPRTDLNRLALHLPSVGELLESYIRALGGTAAIEKLTSLSERGAIQVQGQPVEIEMLRKSPDKETLIEHLPNGTSISTFDGHSGWNAVDGHPPHELHGVDLEVAQLLADLQLPLHIQKLFSELHVEYPERVNQREVNVLTGKRVGQADVTFYFDKQTGLLVRVVLAGDSPLGLNPRQIDFAAYGDVDGVQIPFQLEFSQPMSDVDLRFEDVKENVPIDDARFAKPVAERTTTTPTHKNN
jgi:photosynthetic reaction center cytochrome c subunit